MRVVNQGLGICTLRFIKSLGRLTKKAIHAEKLENLCYLYL